MITDEMRRKAYAVRERRAFRNAERFKDKRTAYQHGYRVGYNRAFRAWKARCDQIAAAVSASGRRG
jgi:hypothetical protein